LGIDLLGSSDGDLVPAGRGAVPVAGLETVGAVLPDRAARFVLGGVSFLGVGVEDDVAARQCLVRKACLALDGKEAFAALAAADDGAEQSDAAAERQEASSGAGVPWKHGSSPGLPGVNPCWSEAHGPRAWPGRGRWPAESTPKRSAPRRRRWRIAGR